MHSGIIKIIKNLIFFCVVILLEHCYSSVITSTWQTEDTNKKMIKKLLVMAIDNNKDRSIKVKLEKHLVNDLIKRGIEASSSIEKYGPLFLSGLQESEALNKIKGQGFDAVLTVVLLDKEKEKHYIPGRITYTPYSMYYRRFWGYYSTVYDRVYEPGYYTENTNYFWESNLYDLSDKSLIYSAQTKSFNPMDLESLADEYGKIISNDLFKKGILH
jgi:hypothetical protein